MKRQNKYPDTKWFVYENVNPKGKVTTDCVVRAICKALEKTYTEVYDGMFKYSLRTGVHINDKKFLQKYLKTFGYDMLKQPKHEDGTKYTVKEFLEKNQNGTYILSINAHHITVAIDGKVHDIWDCTERVAGNYWKVR